MNDPVTRRRFIQTTSGLGLGLATFGASAAMRRFSPNEKVNVLSIGVVGSIGGTDRSQIAGHPGVEITGLFGSEPEG